MKLYNLRARRPHQIGHRIVQQGETLSRMQFRSDEDARFFINHLRWSAFEVVPAPEAKADEPKPADAAPKAEKPPKAPKPA